MAILVIGEPQMSSVIGRVVQGSTAEKAGFQSGDRILSIGDKPVKKYEDVIIALNESPGKEIDFSVLHPKAEKPVQI